MFVIKSRLLKVEEEPGGYITYVFENLNVQEASAQRYVMVTRFPNWDAPLIREGDIGFLKYKEVIAGEDTWWDIASQKHVAYNYSNWLFESFVHESKPSDLTVML